MDNRDLLTKQYFNGTPQKVSGSVFSARLGNVEFDRDSAVLLLGAPDGAMVHIKKVKKGVVVEATHPFYSIPQKIMIAPDGILHWESIFLNSSAPKGIGTRIAAYMIEAAQAAGFKAIEMMAWGPPRYNGHYTWPRLGWDGEFSEEHRKTLSQKGFSGVCSVSQIMKTAEGRKWWLANGWNMELSFDLDDKGDSMRVLRSYLNSEGVRT